MGLRIMVKCPHSAEPFVLARMDPASQIDPTTGQKMGLLQVETAYDAVYM